MACGRWGDGTGGQAGAAVRESSVHVHVHSPFRAKENVIAPRASVASGSSPQGESPSLCPNVP